MIGKRRKVNKNEIKLNYRCLKSEVREEKFNDIIDRDCTNP